MKKEVLSHRAKGSGHTPAEAGMMAGRVVVDWPCSSSSSGRIDGARGSSRVRVNHQLFSREPSHDAQCALLTHRAATFHSSLLLLGESHGGGRSRSASLQVLTTEGEGGGAVTVGEETEVTDLDEARGQDGAGSAG